MIVQKISAFFSLFVSVWGATFLVKTGADICAGYLLFIYLVLQIIFLIFVACHHVFLGDRSLLEHRKLIFPWLDIAAIGFIVQLVVITSNFLFNTHGGHC
jgi:hypothetical protein